MSTSIRFGVEDFPAMSRRLPGAFLKPKILKKSWIYSISILKQLFNSPFQEPARPCNMFAWSAMINFAIEINPFSHNFIPQL